MRGGGLCYLILTGRANAHSSSQWRAVLKVYPMFIPMLYAGAGADLMNVYTFFASDLTGRRGHHWQFMHVSYS